MEAHQGEGGGLSLIFPCRPGQLFLPHAMPLLYSAPFSSQLSSNKSKMTEVKEALKEQRKLVKALRDELAQEKDSSAKAGLEKKIAHAEKSLTKLQDEVG